MQKYPIFLPHDSKFSELIVADAHELVFHQRVRATLTEVRSRYWITQCRKLVRKMLNNCMICKFIDAKPFLLPAPPEFPDYRVEIAPPFTNIGIDHLGPLWVKEIYENSEIAMHKAYVALTSCCVSRMVHLELQPNLQADTFVRTLKRIFSRVGTPSFIISDNHKTFKSKKVRDFVKRLSIRWKFILPLAPHWGGFYERMNGIIKRALQKTLKNSKLTYEELETVIVQIECVINSRPISYIYEDDLAEPLTPSHLLYKRC